MTKVKEKDVCKGVVACKLIDTIKITQKMAYSVQGAFGIDGRAVMFQTCSGQMNITRCGEDILKTVFVCENSVLHPLCNLVMKSILEIRKQLGDGVKTYITLLNILLNKCFNIYNSTLVAKELCTFQTLFTSYFLCSEKPNDFNQNNMRKVIISFFSTRFTKSVSKFLSDIVNNWICRQSNLLSVEILDFSKLIDNFSVFCIHFQNSSTMNSTIRNGCLVKGNILGHNNSEIRKYILKVFLYPEETAIKEDNIESSIRVFLGETLTDSNILLVTNIILPAQTVLYLRSRKIVILQGIHFQQTKFMYEYVLNKELSIEFKIESNSVWLNLERVCQLLLCAPNSDLLRQYQESIVDCLRLLNFVSNKYWLISPPGGNFEQKFAFYLYNTLSKNKMPLFCNRSDLIVWHRLLNKSKMNTSDDFADCSRLVDDFIKNILKNFENVTLDDDVVNIICSSLWEISRFVCDTSDIDTADKGDPVVLKVEILMRSVDMVIRLIKLNGIVFTKSNSLL